MYLIHWIGIYTFINQICDMTKRVLSCFEKVLFSYFLAVIDCMPLL